MCISSLVNPKTFNNKHCVKYSIVEYIKIVTKINQIFNVNLPLDKTHICSNINEIISFI